MHHIEMRHSQAPMVPDTSAHSPLHPPSQSVNTTSPAALPTVPVVFAFASILLCLLFHLSLVTGYLALLVLMVSVSLPDCFVQAQERELVVKLEQAEPAHQAVG